MNDDNSIKKEQKWVSRFCYFDSSLESENIITGERVKTFN